MGAAATRCALRSSAQVIWYVSSVNASIPARAWFARATVCVAKGSVRCPAWVRAAQRTACRLVATHLQPRVEGAPLLGEARPAPCRQVAPLVATLPARPTPPLVRILQVTRILQVIQPRVAHTPVAGRAQAAAQSRSRVQRRRANRRVVAWQGRAKARLSGYCHSWAWRSASLSGGVGGAWVCDLGRMHCSAIHLVIHAVSIALAPAPSTISAPS